MPAFSSRRVSHSLCRRAAIGAIVLCSSAAAAPSVVDDLGARVTLAQPAERIVSLAPHLTELLFEVGAGPRIVGAIEYSDFPPEAVHIPRVGNASGISLEGVLALRPDLIVAWRSGNPVAQVERLAALGIPVYWSQPKDLEDVASSLERLAVLSGAEARGRARARAFRARLAELRSLYRSRPKVRVFFQIWDRPTITVNRAHVISDVIGLCGGKNVFADLPLLAPQVSTEAVIAADPEAILASERPGADPFARWRSLPAIAAVRAGNLFLLPEGVVARHGPRILDGAARVCEALERARARRARRGD